MRKTDPKILIKVIAAALALSVFINETGPVMVSHATGTEKELDEAQSDFEETTEKKESAADDLDRLMGEKDSLEGVLADLNGKLGDAGEILEGLEDNIENTQTEIDKTWGRIEELSVSIDALTTEAEAEYDKAKEQIKFAYETGNDFRMIFPGGDGTYADYLNRAVYMQMFTRYYQDTINELIATGEALSEAKSEYEKNLMDLEHSRAALEDYQDTVRQQYDEINAGIEEASGRLSDYEDQIDDTEERIREYEEQLALQENNIEVLKARIEEEKRLSSQAENGSWRDISSISASASDRKLLANLIWCEAGNEPYTGQVAVGAVVMNRVMSSVFPDTITGVIYQGKQFTPAYSGRLALALSRDSADESCYKAADAALSGVTNVSNCLYFRTPVSSVTPKYTIGGHIFY